MNCPIHFGVCVFRSNPRAKAFGVNETSAVVSIRLLPLAPLCMLSWVFSLVTSVLPVFEVAYPAYVGWLFPFIELLV